MYQKNIWKVAQKIKPSLRIRTASNDCLPYEKSLLFNPQQARTHIINSTIAEKSLNYFFFFGAFAALAKESATTFFAIESAFAVESAFAFKATESTAGATVAEESGVLVESVDEAAPEPPPQAAKTPRANTKTSFFMLCECLIM